MENNKITDLLLEKFVQEEIMTKSEFEKRLDAIMDRRDAILREEMTNIRHEIKNELGAVHRDMQAMEARIDRQFHKIDGRYNWIIGLIIATAVGIASLLLRSH